MSDNRSPLFLGFQDTICALATPEGKGGLSVIRLSGSKSYQTIKKLCPTLPSQPESHKAYYTKLFSLEKNLLDEVIVTFFEKGRSFTSDEVVEISCHGGSVISGNILKELLKLEIRQAGRGEFTFRAFLNKKIDLVQAESIQSLVSSSTQTSASQSLMQLQGDLSKKIKIIEEKLLKISAHIEAQIDFSEEDLSEDLDDVTPLLKNALLSLDELLGSYEKGRALCSGLEITLLGKPNVGKSSLFNALLGSERSIVTGTAGTTRDYVSETQERGNISVTWNDTAGLRDTDNEIEIEGVKRAEALARKSHFIFYVIDSTSLIDFEDIEEIKKLDDKKVFVILNKIDLKPPSQDSIKIDDKLFYLHPVSASKNQGLEKLWEAVFNRLGLQEGVVTDNTLVTESRHFELLLKARGQVKKALQDKDIEEKAYKITQALKFIYEISGKEVTEDVLDKIFQEFCLGK